MLFIEVVDEFLTSIPLLEDVSLTTDSEILWTNGYRLGINWPWLLHMLAPLKQKHKALKYIAFNDKRNMSNNEGFCWTFKHAESGVWSGLRDMQDMGLTQADHEADLLKAEMHLA